MTMNKIFVTNNNDGYAYTKHNGENGEEVVIW